MTPTASRPSRDDNVAPARRRRLRNAAVAASALLLLFAALATVLRIRFHGEALATFVSGTLNDRIRGKVEIGSIEWPMGSLPAALVGGWLPITAHNVEVFDEFGTVVLRTKRATAEVELVALALGPDFHFRNIVVPADGEGYALIKDVKEPYPVHEYDSSVRLADLSLLPETSAGLPRRPFGQELADL